MADQQKTDTSASTVEIMEQGRRTFFWGELVKITQENIKMLETEIITKIDTQTGHDLTDEEVDRRRDKRQAMEDLINLPGDIIAQHQREDQGEEDYDPYPNNARDIAAMKEPEDSG